MDTSSPAVFVNGELLKMYVGRRVRAVLNVAKNEGGVTSGKCTDGQQLTVKGGDATSFPVSHYVEVIGIADSNQSIRVEICTDFGEQFEQLPVLDNYLLHFIELLLRPKKYQRCFTLAT